MTHARNGAKLPRAMLAGLSFLMIGLGLTACGTTSTSSPDTITVVTGLWPLEQAAAAIGGSSVQVSDVVPAGANPMTWRPDAAARETIKNADVVLEVGGGFQPAFERAAKANSETVYLDGPLQVKNPYLWLNPARMLRVARLVYQAMIMANPNAEATYQEGLSTFSGDLSTIGQRYAHAFAGCHTPVVTTEDDTLSVLRPQFPLSLRRLDGSAKTWPSAEQTDTPKPGRQTQIIRHNHVTTVLSETWAPKDFLATAKKATGVKVVTVNTLISAPSRPSARTTYLNELTKNLELIRSGLTC